MPSTFWWFGKENQFIFLFPRPFHSIPKPLPPPLSNRFLSLTWKVTNTMLVLLMVSMAGFFPKAAYMLGWERCCWFRSASLEPAFGQCFTILSWSG
jgi:hypothetical protein